MEKTVKFSRNELEELSKVVRMHCVQAAREGFQDASMSGLCSEGAMEAAVGAIQSVDIKQIITDWLDRQSL